MDVGQPCFAIEVKQPFAIVELKNCIIWGDPGRFRWGKWGWIWSYHIIYKYELLKENISIFLSTQKSHTKTSLRYGTYSSTQCLPQSALPGFPCHHFKNYYFLKGNFIFFSSISNCTLCLHTTKPKSPESNLKQQFGKCAIQGIKSDCPWETIDYMYLCCHR